MLLETLEALKQYILSKQQMFDEALAPWGETLRQVYTYENQTIEIDQFPCMVLVNPRVQSQFIAAPSYLQYDFEVPTMGYTLFTDSEDNAKQITAFADCVRRVMESWYQSNYQIPTTMMSNGQPVNLHCPVDKPPFGDYNLGYEVASDQKTLIRSFDGNIRCLCEAGIGAI